jgi:hypothetical protein
LAKEIELKDLKNRTPRALAGRYDCPLKPITQARINRKKNNIPHNSNTESICDRLVVVSVPNYHRENQPKGIKLIGL